MLKEKIDFYFNEDGLMVLTKEYLLQRGYCCSNGCKHCPYKNFSSTLLESNHIIIDNQKVLNGKENN